MKLTYSQQRGYQHWVCLVCNRFEKERIPDQADDRYHHNPASPWTGVCGHCSGGTASASIRLGNSTVAPQPSPPDEYHKPDIDGLWGDFWEVAKRYERKAPVQDREDLRHNIIIRLVEVAWAREANGEAFGEVARLRTASYVVMEYWHTEKRNGKIVSLNSPIADADTDTTELWETLPDDTAINLDTWIDARTWLLGCPKRLVQIAQKRVAGIALEPKEKMYLGRFRRQRQLSLFGKATQNNCLDTKALQNQRESP